MGSRIANRIRQIAPLFLRSPAGWPLLGSIVRMFDDVAEAAEDGASAALITECEDDALEAHASNTNDRRVSRETLPQLRSYLRKRWDRKKEAGTEDALHFQLNRLGYPAHVLVCERELREAGITGAFGGNVGYAFLVIRPPFLSTPTISWDGTASWSGGGLWGGGGLSPDQVGEIKDMLRRWKPAGTSFRFIVVDTDGLTNWDISGLHGNYSVIPLNDMRGAFVPYYNHSYLTP